MENPAGESTKQCVRAYQKFIDDYPEYDVDVLLCAFSKEEMKAAKKMMDKVMKEKRIENN